MSPQFFLRFEPVWGFYPRFLYNCTGELVSTFLHNFRNLFSFCKFHSFPKFPPILCSLPLGDLAIFSLSVEVTEPSFLAWHFEAHIDLNDFYHIAEKKTTPQFLGSIYLSKLFSFWKLTKHVLAARLIYPLLSWWQVVLCAILGHGVNKTGQVQRSQRDDFFPLPLGICWIQKSTFGPNLSKKILSQNVFFCDSCICSWSRSYFSQNFTQ